MKNAAELGSVSSGTMRADDLIPCFLDELKLLSDSDDVDTLITGIEERMEGEDYFESEDAGWDLSALFDALDGYAPEGAYFGAHPDDGADYGFWMDGDAEVQS